MPVTGKTLGSDNTSAQPLPLFRPEAVAAVQQKFYGETILIRPFSLVLLCWFALGITAAVLGFLFLGQYKESVRVPGIMNVARAALAQKSSAELYVPARWIDRVHPGDQLSLRCESCSAKSARQTGTVLQVPDAPLAPQELSQIDLDTSGPIYKIVVSLTPQAAQITQLNPSPQTGMRVVAEIPLGRKPLIKWFFERPGS
jgi:hypothetical protein